MKYRYTITENCILCGICASQCPRQAIAKGVVHNEIDLEKCIGCGLCYENCPVEAIEEEELA